MTTVDPPTGTTATMTATTSATTTSETSSMTSISTTTEADSTSTPEDSSDSEPNDECAFTESFDGPDGSEWPDYWTPVGGIAIADIQGGRGRLVPTPSPYAVARIVTPLDCTDVEVTYSFELRDAPAQGHGLYVRQNGGYLQQTNPAGEGYSMFVEAFLAPPGISVWRETGGVEQMFEPKTPMDVQSNVVYHARFRVTQTTPAMTRLQAKFWPDGTAEPGAFQVDITDGTPSLQNAGGNLAVDAYTTLTSGMSAETFIDDIVVTAAR